MGRSVLTDRLGTYIDPFTAETVYSIGFKDAVFQEKLFYLGDLPGVENVWVDVFISEEEQDNAPTTVLAGPKTVQILSKMNVAVEFSFYRK